MPALLCHDDGSIIPKGWLDDYDRATTRLAARTDNGLRHFVLIEEDPEGVLLYWEVEVAP